MQDKVGYRIAVAGVAAALGVFLVMAAVIVVTGARVPTEYWTTGSAVGGALLGILAPTPSRNALSKTQQSASAAHRMAADAYQKVAKQASEATTDLAQAAANASQAAQAADSHAAAAASFTSYIPALALLCLFVASTLVWLVGHVTELQAFAAASGTALLGLLAPSPTT